MSLNKFDLSGRTAMITGGSKGLGAAMANALAGAGADVAVTSRHLDESAATAKRIEEETGRRALAVKMDVGDRIQVDEGVAKIEGELGKIDILINNAGINIRSPLADLEDDDWNQVINTNLNGVMYCARAVGKGMVSRNYGRIVNVSSTLGHVAIAGRTAYASSKGAVIQFSKVLALEWAPHNITVNALCPGPFLTEINIPVVNDKEVYQKFVDAVPMGRFGDPEEIGGAAVFLSSDASSYMTGTTLLIDGGWTAK
ncbi:MAG: glucose 1-dehydrogenase [Candidatus Latescibacteria bacterium]|nr:glucose 1-dehydrogenase [Candidatus Latescibacterota bacterium]